MISLVMAMVMGTSVGILVLTKGNDNHTVVQAIKPWITIPKTHPFDFENSKREV